MVTYLQLESEQVWVDQVVPPFMTSFLIVPLRNFYGMGPDLIGAPGDNNHLYGRHRSPNWDRQSRYCTDRSYGTTDSRDHAGDQDWYRAVDIGIQGDTLHAACHRLDNAVRAGQLPEVAEWFGTFDGHTVVGWYEGHPSSSDSSHLYHMHVGFWTEYADNFQVMQRVYGIITGTATEDDMTPDESRRLFNVDGMMWYGLVNGQDIPPGGIKLGDGDGTPNADAVPVWAVVHIKALEAKVHELEAKIDALTGVELTPEQLAEIAGAAHNGAAGAIDGATVSGAVISTKKP
jgi:hypothetical protein